MLYHCGVLDDLSPIDRYLYIHMCVNIYFLKIENLQLFQSVHRERVKQTVTAASLSASQDIKTYFEPQFNTHMFDD